MSLSPRLIAIQGLGFSPIQVATQGLLDYISSGGETRRPKSTNTLKLQRIKEGRATALSAKASTKIRVVQASGARVAPVTPALPGQVVLLSARAHARTQPIRGTGHATAACTGARMGTRTQISSSAGGSTAMCASARSRTRAWGAESVGGVRVSLKQFTSFTSQGEARGAGVRNLSDAEVAAIVRVTIDKRR